MRRSSTLYTFLFIVALTALAAWIAYPGSRSVLGIDARLVQGLDLQGGLQVLLEAPPNATGEQVDDAREIVEQRVNNLSGVLEPVIQRQGERRIVVELPGVENPEQAIETFQSTGQLEIVDASAGPPQVGEVIRTSLGEQQGAQPTGTPGPLAFPTSGTAVVRAPEGPPASAQTPGAAGTPAPEATPAAAPTDPETPEGPVYQTIIQGSDIASAQAGFDPQTNAPVVSFQLRPEAAQRFGEFTASHIGQPLAVAADKRVINVATINDRITDQGQITGVSLEEAQSLAIQLRYGALPVPLEVVSSNTVGASLGQDSIDRSIVAGIIGVIAVGLFMTLYYRLPGFISVLALLIYSILVFAIFKLEGFVTLTLAGIAAFVLSIGMAVDANVLIFARMKEELRRGRNVRQAVEAGFRNAWPSIRDSNVSTLITSVILFWFGSTFGASIIRSFALTLAIGVLVSMFTAIVVTRTLLRMLVGFPAVRNVWLWGIGRDEVSAPPPRPGAGPAFGGTRAG